MSAPIGVEIYGPIAGAVVAAGTWLAARLAKADARIVDLEGQVADLQDARVREMRRNVALWLSPPPVAPAPPPQPDWEETTGVRDMRASVERDELLRRFLESTPPRAYRPPQKSHRDK